MARADKIASAICARRPAYAEIIQGHPKKDWKKVRNRRMRESIENGASLAEAGKPYGLNARQVEHALSTYG